MNDLLQPLSETLEELVDWARCSRGKATLPFGSELFLLLDRLKAHQARLAACRLTTLFQDETMDAPKTAQFTPFLAPEGMGYQVNVEGWPTSYLYLIPSSETEGRAPDVFAYRGETGNPCEDTPLYFCYTHAKEDKR